MDPVPTSKARRHHLIPQAYLRRFAADGRHLSVFDRRTRQFRTDGPANIAVENDFNTLVAIDGTKEHWVEPRLARMESAALKCFDKIEAGVALTPEERWYTSFFLGYADTRGTGFREEHRDHQPTTGPLDKRFADAYAAATGVYLPPPTLERIIREEMAHLPTDRVTELGLMVGTAMEYAMHFARAPWVIATSPPETAFLTSDRPLGMLRYDPDLHETLIERDPRRPDTLTIFPLSPRRAIWILGIMEPGPPTNRVLPSTVVRLANRALAAHADRFVVAPDEDLLRAVVKDAGLVNDP